MDIFEHYLALTQAFFEHVGANALSTLQHYLTLVQPLLERYGYAAVFGAVLVEGFGIPAPGQTLVIAGAIDSAKGGMSIAAVLALAFCAAVIGNTIGYGIGRWGGHYLLHKVGVNAQRMQRMENVFNRYGGGVVVVGRFFDGLRQLTGIVAGGLGMSLWKFSLFNILGAAIWTGLWGLGSYYLGHNVHAVFAVFHYIEPYLIVACLAAVVLLLIYLVRERR